MTKQRTNETRRRNWDNVVNEGGEGYNPYDQVETGQRTTSRLSQLYREHSRLMTSNPNDPRYARMLEVEAEINALESEQERERDEEWTVETTKARRVEWNERWTALNKPSDYADQVRARIGLEDDLGYKFADLKEAVKRHGL